MHRGRRATLQQRRRRHRARREPPRARLRLPRLQWRRQRLPQPQRRAGRLGRPTPQLLRARMQRASGLRPRRELSKSFRLPSAPSFPLPDPSRPPAGACGAGFFSFFTATTQEKSPRKSRRECNFSTGTEPLRLPTRRVSLAIRGFCAHGALATRSAAALPRLRHVCLRRRARVRACSAAHGPADCRGRPC